MIETWYEEHGSGDPLVLLHPGGADARAVAPNLGALAEHFRVFTPERRGRGRTPDVDGPITYELMARDTIDFLEEVVGGPAHLVGNSGGAIVALVTALRRPDLSRRLAVISGVFHRDGGSRRRSIPMPARPRCSRAAIASSPPTGPTTTRWSSQSSRA